MKKYIIAAILIIATTLAFKADNATGKKKVTLTDAQWNSVIISLQYSDAISAKESKEITDAIIKQANDTLINPTR